MAMLRLDRYIGNRENESLLVMKFPTTCIFLTLIPPNKLSRAKCFVCFNIQSALMLLKVGENVV